MKSPFSISLILNACSVFSIIVALFAVEFLRGEDEQTVVKISGVLLVLSSIGSQRLFNRTPQKRIDLDRSEQTKSVLLAQNILAGIGVFAALVAGYLIFFPSDSFPGRKLYLLLATATVGVSLALSRLLPLINWTQRR